MNRIKQNLKYLKIRDFLEMLILIVALPISLVFRIYNKIKRRNLWLICEDGTTARDNGYHFYKYIKEKHPEEYCYYVIDKKSEEYEKVKKYRDVVHFKSFKHWIYYLSAKWNIVAQKKGNPSKVLFYVLHICLGMMNNRVYLKHGIVKDSLDHHFYENTKFKYFICGAKKEYEYVKENHGYPNGSVVYTGLARFDNLHNFEANKKQILIMPTWRNYLGRETNFLGEKIDFVLTDYYKCWNGLINSKRLIKFIEENDITVLFYMHIEMRKYWKKFKSTSKNIKFLDLNYDIQEVLKSTSLLITDFSSVFMDYAYMRKPIVYFQFDKEDYRNSGYREGYFSYERDGFGPVTENIEETIEKIENYITNDYKVENIYLQRMKDFFEIYDNKNCERIYELLKKDERNNKNLINNIVKRRGVKNMEKVRGFEIAKGFEDKEINLPVRKTKYSAGYDIEAAEDCVIPAFKPGQTPTLVKTGLKAYMADDEYLMLCNRSSNPKKKGLILANSVGIVDKDYYGNPDNDGHMMFAFYNIKDVDVEIKKGEAIGQAIFQKYFVADEDNAEGERVGGFGSTSK